ncbi:MAG: ABC transporter permease [Desulfobacterales bacterium]|nr:MAG: ABC transporter permease [Desulfobacterales bacterium]
MKKHLGRALTVLLGIALGAAVFTSVRLSVHAALDSFTRSMEVIAGSADWVMVQPGGQVPEEWVAKLLQLSVVQEASPVLTTYVRLADKKSEPFLLIGIDPIMDRNFRSWQTSEYADQDTESWVELIKRPYTLIIGKSLADKYTYRRGDHLTIEHTRQIASFDIIGILSFSGLAMAEGGMIAVTDIGTFQEFTKLYGLVDRIDIKIAPNAPSNELDDLRKILPDRFQLAAPSAAKERGRGMIRAYQLNLSILSFASLFVGMFLVYSLVALNAASRRHELAVLRATGASPYLLFQVFLAEGVLLGIIGWLMALPISTILIKYLLQGVSQTISILFAKVQVDKLSLSPWEITLSFGVTVFTSSISALQPAWEAMQVSPNEALEISRHGMTSKASPHKLVMVGIVCLFLVVPLSLLPEIMNMTMPGYFSVLMLFIGFSLFAPWGLQQMGHALSSALYRIAGIPAYLAGRYVRDSGTRTAVSVGALITAVALFTSLVIMIYSFRSTVELWTDQTVSGDLFITTKMGEINRFRYPVPRAVVDELEKFKNRVDIVPSRRYFLNYNNFSYEFELLDVDVFFRHGDFVWLKGDSDRVQTLLKQGKGVVISEVFSNRTGLTIGNKLRTRIESSFVELPVLGIIRDYRTRGGVAFFSLSQFKNRYHDVQWGGCRIFLKDRTKNLEAAVASLQNELIGRWGDNLDIISGHTLRSTILRVFDETFAITTVLLLIALAIAALGIATTLTVLVLERSKQLNTLYAVGADYGQIRSMILWEAAFMVVAGELAGIICGFILSYILVYVINRQSFGWTFLYEVDWTALAMSFPLIILTALAAAFPAIKMVFRESPATLLREN